VKQDDGSAVVQGSPRVGPARKVMHWLAFPALIAALGAGALAAYGTWEYGSPAAALLALRGHAVAVKPARMSLGKLTPGVDVPLLFTVQNLKSVPVTVVGARSSCQCTSVTGLPIVIPVGRSADLSASIVPRLADAGKNLAGQVQLYLDVPSPPILFSVFAEVSSSELIQDGL
jgi:hypothetical protein